MKRNKLAGVISISIACSGWLLPAHGQEKSVVSIQEITVTARKREENLLEVPLAVTAFTAQDIEATGASDINDIADHTPGLFYNSSFGRANDRPAIRGMSQIRTDGGRLAGIFIDGIYVSGSLQAVELNNLERVEVIRGPQSALYGRSTLSGAINYVTKKPSDVLEGGVTVKAGEYDLMDVSGYLSGPLSEVLSYYVSARAYEKDGQYKNQLSGLYDIGGEKSSSVSGKLYWTPSDTFEAIMSVSYAEDDDEMNASYTIAYDENNPYRSCINTGDEAAFEALYGAAGDFNDGYYCGEVKIDKNAIYLTSRNDLVPPGNVDGSEAANGASGFKNGKAGTKRETLRLSLALNWDIGEYTLTSISAYQTEDEQVGFDVTRQGNVSPTAVTYIADGLVEWTDISQEFRLSSPADRQFRYMVGMYYLDNERKEYSYHARTIPFDERDQGVIDTLNTAVFGQMEYDFTDKLTASAELRYQRDKLSIATNLYETQGSRGNTVRVDLGPVNATENYYAVLPRVTLDYQALDNLLVYASVAKGNRPGNFNSSTRLPLNLLAVDEEEALSYELGVKGSFFDGRVSAMASVYFIDWEDMQLSSTFTTADLERVNYITNAGDAEIKGFELDLKLAAVPDFWDIGVTYGLSDSETKNVRIDVENPDEWERQFVEAVEAGFPIVRDGNGIIQYANVSGTQLPNSPKHTVSFSNTFHGPLGDTGWDWSVRAEYLYTSTLYASVINLAETGERERVNLRAGVSNDSFSITAWVNNVTDDLTGTSITRITDFSRDGNRAFRVSVPEGRTAGVTVNYKF